MKFNLPKLGDKRVRTKFLWLPLTLEYKKIWWETATYIKRFNCENKVHWWTVLKWVD